MEKDKLIFGTLNIPLDNSISSASFNAPAVLPKEIMEKTSFTEIGTIKTDEKITSLTDLENLQKF